MKGLAVSPPRQCLKRQRWLGYHCPFFEDLSSVGRSRYRTSMYTSLSSHLTALSGASCLSVRRSNKSRILSTVRPPSPIRRSCSQSPCRQDLFHQVVSSCSSCVFLSRSISIHLRPFAALFLGDITHLKAPRPFPVRTRSVRTREAVC